MKPIPKEQIATNKLIDEECIDLLKPHRWREKLDFGVWRHLNCLWCLVHRGTGKIEGEE